MTDDRSPDQNGADPIRQTESTAVDARGRRRLLQGAAGAGAFVTVLANRPTFALADSGSRCSGTHSGPGCANTSSVSPTDTSQRTLPEPAQGKAHGLNKAKGFIDEAKGFETGGS
ncbi:hypothetical protein CKO28_13025 [Rhodovibrio sodomensis]|uniref:Uncharacterized protein n=1 Tax=Rhodovibrio sodomensis TaxID=1088 RepID=A0ABS1DFE4_9PROT|nr:hypothetical protein [Rhodovibrio sodomensis]MBK1668954.1 hypothetical protein [Rhodovibrio sodomensis]